MSRRTEMIASTLKQELMSIIMHQLSDPRLEGFPSITRIKVASDLSSADVFVTIMGTEGKQTAALNALKHSAGMMRQRLQKSLPMRTIPFLKFHLDEALKKELQVLELIDKAVHEENELKESLSRATRPDDQNNETPDESTDEQSPEQTPQQAEEKTEAHS